MRGMTLWLSLFAATWLVYVVLALTSARASNRQAGEVLVGVAAASIASCARSGTEPHTRTTHHAPERTA
jgi:hypothetical protein